MIFASVDQGWTVLTPEEDGGEACSGRSLPL